MANVYAPFLPYKGTFVVKNIAINKKILRIFQYPIIYNQTRDLLGIPGVSESDIRASLLKGELLHKILANEIIIINSDIDLLQFNLEQRVFLENAGISIGTRILTDQLFYIRREDIELNGLVNGINTIFSTNEKFIYNDNYKIIVYKNGCKQRINDDFYIAESGGIGTGYDTVIFIIPPENNPVPVDLITADYYVAGI